MSDAKEDGWITKELLRRALDSGALNAEQAELIGKVDLEGRGVVNTAKELDTPKATVSTKHKKALEILKDFSRKDEARVQKDEAAPRVFVLLNQGKKLTEIVQETGYSPEVVEKLHGDFLRLEETDLSHPSVPRRLAELERKFKELTKEKPYWDMTWATLMSTPGVRPNCPNCWELMGDAAIGWKCVKCGFVYP